VFSRQILGRMGFLKRSLIDDLEGGQRVFVFKRMLSAPVADADLKRVVQAIRSYGNCSLLHVRLTEPGHPGGSVDVVDDGLIYGYVDRLPSFPAGPETDFSHWLQVCRQAYRYHLSRGGSTDVDAPSYAAGAPIWAKRRT